MKKSLLVFSVISSLMMVSSSCFDFVKTWENVNALASVKPTYKCYSRIHQCPGYAVVACDDCKMHYDYTDDITCIHDFCTEK